MQGVIIDGNLHTAMIRVGFSIDYAKSFCDMTYFRVEKGGCCKFMGTAHLGRGTKIAVLCGAELEVGDNFAISASSAIKCFKHIKLGKDILFAWDCIVMDSDGHHIFDGNNKIMNPNKNIVLGDHIWMGCGVTVLKEAVIPNNCVIASNTIISSSHYRPNTIIAGNPSASKKDIGTWKI